MYKKFDSKSVYIESLKSSVVYIKISPQLTRDLTTTKNNEALKPLKTLQG